jgi:hypothetical protein
LKERVPFIFRVEEQVKQGEALCDIGKQTVHIYLPQHLASHPNINCREILKFHPLILYREAALQRSFEMLGNFY